MWIINVMLVVLIYTSAIGMVFVYTKISNIIRAHKICMLILQNCSFLT